MNLAKPVSDLEYFMIYDKGISAKWGFRRMTWYLPRESCSVLSCIRHTPNDA